MERFAFKIDAALKANLYKICRLCGIDNPSKVPILLPTASDITDLDEPNLCQKVFELVGFTVTKNDKMPQTMCNLCVDKINDFYEFREMCYATNKQTRKLLGLKQAEPQKLVDVRTIVKPEPSVPVPGNSSGIIKVRGRKRRSEEILLAEAMPAAVPDVKEEPVPWRKKLRLQHQQQQRQQLEAKREPEFRKLRQQQQQLELEAKKEPEPKKLRHHHQQQQELEAKREPEPKKLRHHHQQELEAKREPEPKKLRHHHQQQLEPKKEPDPKKLRLNPESKKELEIKDEPAETAPAETSTKKDSSSKKNRKLICSICSEKFDNKDLVEEHKSQVHVPSIPRYICNACDQTHHNQSDIRAHQLWHKLSKTSYICPVCDESVANAYSFSRHLRDHTLPTPLHLLVLDRECPLCKKTFVTNFFYNTHPCAIRKRKCGGCNRTLSSEATYMRHAPTCSKIYLNHSKHILPEVAHTESQMRIKNEVEEEPPPIISIIVTNPPNLQHEEYMQPVVVLERLGSPLLRACRGPNTLGATITTPKGKSSQRVSSKKYLKRVDQLLKNTMSTLDSIKHEPEVHINDTGPTTEEPEEEAEPPNFSDFHAQDDSPDEEAAEAEETPADNVPSVPTVKPEPLDEAGVKQEPLKLKLKITNTHGQLNSSLVDEADEAQPKGSKKKKKRKHKERQKEVPPPAPTVEPTPPPVETPAEAVPTIAQIKQEPSDDNAPDAAPQATVMTSIPITQLESNYNEPEQPEQTEPAEVAAEVLAPPEEPDVKPNRLELDRLMQITHVASGVQMEEEPVAEKPVEKQPTRSPPKKRTVKSTARKSTGGVQRERQPPSPPKEPPNLPQIVAVESGAAIDFNIMPEIPIKPEPQSRGYADEEMAEPETQRETESESENEANNEQINHNEEMAEPEKQREAESESENEINHNEEMPESESENEDNTEQSNHNEEMAEPETQRETESESEHEANTEQINHNEELDEMNEEDSYIKSLDFNNVTIKQEKDLDINDVQANGNQIEDMHLNGMEEEEEEEEEDDEDEDDDEEEDDTEDEGEEEEIEEERIYREIELPPLEPQTEMESFEAEIQEPADKEGSLRDPCTEQQTSPETANNQEPPLELHSQTEIEMEEQNDLTSEDQQESQTEIESAPEQQAQDLPKEAQSEMITDNQQDCHLEHQTAVEAGPQTQLSTDSQQELLLEPQGELNKTEASQELDTEMQLSLEQQTGLEAAHESLMSTGSQQELLLEPQIGLSEREAPQELATETDPQTELEAEPETDLLLEPQTEIDEAVIQQELDPEKELGEQQRLQSEFKVKADEETHQECVHQEGLEAAEPSMEVQTPQESVLEHQAKLVAAELSVEVQNLQESVLEQQAGLEAAKPSMEVHTQQESVLEHQTGLETAEPSMGVQTPQESVLEHQIELETDVQPQQELSLVPKTECEAAEMEPNETQYELPTELDAAVTQMKSPNELELGEPTAEAHTGQAPDDPEAPVPCSMPLPGAEQETPLEQEPLEPPLEIGISPQNELNELEPEPLQSELKEEETETNAQNEPQFGPQTELEARAQQELEEAHTEFEEAPTALEVETQQLPQPETRTEDLTSQPAPAFSFVITSVCSQAEEFAAKTDFNSDDAPCEAASLPAVTLSSPKDNETEAQPIFDSPLATNETQNCEEEEQQNALNHEISDQQPPPPPPPPPAEDRESPGPSERPNEETENHINEQQQQQQQEQPQQQCPANDDFNINEIAENTNNANIERELQDDAIGAEENVNE